MGTRTASKFRWGFKAEADRKAVEVRRSMGLVDRDPLSALRLAKHLRVPVTAMQRIPGLPPDVQAELCGEAGCHALTLLNPPWVLYNAANSPARQQSDLMHEFAHILLGHEPNEIVPYGGVYFFQKYDERQEEEAKWLGGCLQITREGLIWALKRRMSNEAIAEFYTASVEMVRFRRNTSGVDQQLGRWPR